MRPHVLADPVIMVTGSRTFLDEALIYRSLDTVAAEYQRLILRHGKCPKGADAISDQWAEDRGHPRDPMPADWDQFGKEAGFRRNEAMVQKDPMPRLVVAFVDLCLKGDCWPQPHPSHGTAHAMSVAELAKIPVVRYFLEAADDQAR